MTLNGITFLLAFLSVSVSGEYLDPHCNGKQVIVSLFQWKWTDVAKECERFLGPWGFCGVQVSPAGEHAIITSPKYPWWQQYQPVSYKLVSRSGTEAQFADMVNRCNAVGVRVFVDVVVNHMAGAERSGQGTGGTQFDGASLSYPGVPYSSVNFNSRSKCPSSDGHVNNYSDPNNVRNCCLPSLTDLDQSQDHVRQMIVEFFNHLLDLGVAGFRVDASKHMWPSDLSAIQAATKDTQFGGKPFYMHEMIDQNDGAIKVNEYYGIGRVTEFRYCQKITEGIGNFETLGNLVDYGWDMADNDHALIFVDNHHNQRSHGKEGRVTTHKTPHKYKLATAFTLALDYGFTRVMSSFEFGDDTEQGPPHYADYSTADVTINRDGSCGGGWVCEHRWPAIRGMALFRNAATGTDIDNYYNQNDVVAFSRGNKGFFAMGKQSFEQRFQTGLPAGDYCDLISNCRQKITVDTAGEAFISPADLNDPVVAFIADGPSGPIQEGTAGSFDSSGSEVGYNNTVEPESETSTVTEQTPTQAVSDHACEHVPGSTTDSDGHRPGCVGDVSGNTNAGTQKTTVSTSLPQSTQHDGKPSFQRTVILIERHTNPGQDLFIRGGISHDHRQGCTNDASNSPCAIPIRHRKAGTGDHYAKVNAWSTGDNYLDWYGVEPGQGTYNGQQAQGTPAVWTSNDPTHPGHSDFNTFGEHYWLVDIDMDCSKTVDSYFEFKSVIDGWESDIHQASCTGSGAGTPPFSSSDHVSRCGYMNVFHFGSASCSISPLS